MEAQARVPVIVLDDDPDEHFLFEAALIDGGLSLDVHCFSQLQPAWQFCDSLKGAPAVVFLDLSLIIGSVPAFIAKILNAFPNISVGAFSGVYNEILAPEISVAGAAFYATKPITPAEFSAIIADLPHLELGPDGNGQITVLVGDQVGNSTRAP